MIDLDSWGQVLNVEFPSTAFYASPMARPLRIEYPGAVNHLTARGNAGEDVFLDDGDRRLFLGFLAETIARAEGLHYSSISKIIRAWEENSTFQT